MTKEEALQVSATMLIHKQIQRFITVAESGCHECSLKPNDDGYPRLIVAGRWQMAHRFVYQMAGRDLPGNMLLCHVCDNRACVNPDHMFVGTIWENLEDRDRKGRQAKGERNGGAVLTEANVLNILSDTRPQTAIAKDYGVAQCTISSIKRGKLWKHLHTGKAI